MVPLLAVLVIALVVLAIAGWALWLLISAAVVGAVIGGLARLVLPGRQSIGIFSTILLGWIGSIVGSLVGRHVFHVGSVLTVLCEIAVAAALVVVASSAAGSTLARRHGS